MVRTLRDKLQARDSRFLDNYASGFFVGMYIVHWACPCAVCSHFSSLQPGSPPAGDRDLLNLRSSIYEAEDAAGVLPLTMQAQAL